MSLMTTGSFPKGLLPGIKKWFFEDSEHPDEYSQVFDKVTSDKAFEEYAGVSGFGLAPVKAQSAGIAFDSARQGFVTRLTNVAYGLGFMVTHEAMKDGNWGPQAKMDAKSLRKSFKQTKEHVFGLILSRAFATYLGGDGVVLCSASHPNKSGGTYSNLLTTAADLSEASLEAMLEQIMQAKDDRGLALALRARALIVHPNDFFNATRILKSALQNDTANNAVNAVKETGSVPKIVVNRYFSYGSGAWFLKTDADGLVYQEREALTFDQDHDKGTRNMHFYAYERYAGGWYYPKAIYGTPGA